MSNAANGMGLGGHNDPTQGNPSMADQLAILKRFDERAARATKIDNSPVGIKVSI